MDMKAKMNEILDKIKNDKNFAKNFYENPVKTVKDTFGIDLPEEQIDKIVKTIKSKMTVENIADITGKLGNLFGGKKD
ncbi:MAG: hypothetical protein K2G88_06340 [Oscillospiraceae bacterium]|nr:hypothetical protein [Oscillospiraceae bacterium]